MTKKIILASCLASIAVFSSTSMAAETFQKQEKVEGNQVIAVTSLIESTSLQVVTGAKNLTHPTQIHQGEEIFNSNVRNDSNIPVSANLWGFKFGPNNKIGSSYDPETKMLKLCKVGCVGDDTDKPLILTVQHDNTYKHYQDTQYPTLRGLLVGQTELKNGGATSNLVSFVGSNNHTADAGDYRLWTQAYSFVN